MVTPDLDADHGNGESLQLSSRQVSNISRLHLSQLQQLANFILLLHLVLLVKELLHTPLHCFGNLVHILRLDNSLEVILKDFCEVILQLASTKVGKNLSPVGGLCESPKIWFLFPCQDF